MDRVPEPEIMDDPHQALAYARADFADVNQRFVDDLLGRFPFLRAGRVVDLGCGPADIPLRLAAAAPGLRIVGVDGSLPMLRLARQALVARGPGRRVALLCARLPAVPLPAGAFDAVVSNSLLHHLPDPGLLWSAVARLGRPGAAVHVMDLFRPGSVEEAHAIVERAAGSEDPVLKADFFNSLLAAWTPDEVKRQLDDSGLAHLTCAVVSERHLLVSGTL
jgi:SAM-dependent methyltransferase